MRATEVKMEVTLIVEYPEDAHPLNTIALGEWLGDQLGTWIVLPFDSDTRALLEINTETFDDGKVIDYELDPICHSYVT